MQINRILYTSNALLKAWPYVSFLDQISDPFPAWVVKNGFAEDVKIQFIWGMSVNISRIFCSSSQGHKSNLTYLTQVDKSIAAMYKKLQKNLTSEELLPSLWDKCKVS